MERGGPGDGGRLPAGLEGPRAGGWDIEIEHSVQRVHTSETRHVEDTPGTWQRRSPRRLRCQSASALLVRHSLRYPLAIYSLTARPMHNVHRPSSLEASTTTS